MNIQNDNQHIIYKQKRMFNGHLNLRIQQKKQGFLYIKNNIVDT